MGASVERGGAANGPAAKYSLRKYMGWLRKYAPPGALGMDFYTYLPVLAKGHVAQQIFWYTAFTSDMDNLAREQDRVLQRIQRANVQGDCGPKPNPKRDASYWLNQPGSPKAKVNEKPRGETVDYDQLIQAWREGRVK